MDTALHRLFLFLFRERFLFKKYTNLKLIYTNFGIILKTVPEPVCFGVILTEGEKMRYVGKSYPIHDAEQKASGRAVYAGDMEQKGMLYGAVLFSEIPHGIVKALDCRRALDHPVSWISRIALTRRKRSTTAIRVSSDRSSSKRKEYLMSTCALWGIGSPV